jgi:aspartate racemase
VKRIGVLGGMSWESTQSYYRLLNEGVKRALGGHHSAEIVLISVDFEPIRQLQYAGDWVRAGELLAAAAQRAEAGGADLLLLATNTMHVVADAIARAIRIPLLHIGDATAQRIRAAGITRVGLLGTRFTMEQAFYRERLHAHGIESLVPDEAMRARVHAIIYDELCLGEIRDASRAEYLRAIAALEAAGAQAIIAGCTEITLLVQQQHVALPLFDTTAIHVEEAVAAALEGVAR